MNTVSEEETRGARRSSGLLDLAKHCRGEMRGHGPNADMTRVISSLVDEDKSYLVDSKQVSRDKVQQKSTAQPIARKTPPTI